MSDIELKSLPYNIMGVPFEVKSEDITEEGIFGGYGSTFGGEPDSYGDVVVYGAYADTIRKQGKLGIGIKMLRNHIVERPVGKWSELVENKKGLKVKGQLAVKTDDGRNVYEFMKLGILNSLSIGWEPLRKDSEGLEVKPEDAIEWDEKKGIRYLKKIDLWEISPVTFPANPRAGITTVKDVRCIIEKAKTVRELESAFIEYGMSNNAAKYIVSLCKNKLNLREGEEVNSLHSILKELRSVNADLLVGYLLNKADEEIIGG